MNFIDQITNYIIRPSRQRYHINRLGPKQIYLPITQKPPQSTSPNHQNQPTQYPYISIFRDDYNILTPQNRTLYYSYYTNHMTQHPDLCIVYLHANNGSRVQGLHYVQELFKARFNVCLIDFTGSGWSQGQYVALGCNQSYDLDAVCRHMRGVKGIKYVVLWGRSMGACTALMFTSKFKDNNCIGMILDSPFKDLRKLVKQTAKQKTGLPQFFFQPILSFVDSQLQKKINHTFNQYQMHQYIPQKPTPNQYLIPILFISSQMDKLVKSHHVQQLYELYPGRSNMDKFLYYIENQHHQDRDQETVRKCVGFVRDVVGRFYFGGRVGVGTLRIQQDGGGKSIKQVSLFQNSQILINQPKYSLKTQRLLQQSQIAASQKQSQHLNYQYEHQYQPTKTPTPANNNHPKYTQINFPAKLELTKQKQKHHQQRLQRQQRQQRRKKGPGIQLIQHNKQPKQSSPQNPHMKTSNSNGTKRFSQPSIQKQSYQQRINLSKNIKIKMNQSYQNLSIGVYPNYSSIKQQERNRIALNNIQMIQSFGASQDGINIIPNLQQQQQEQQNTSIISKTTTRKINLREFKSPRDRYQQYYPTPSNNSTNLHTTTTNQSNLPHHHQQQQQQKPPNNSNLTQQQNKPILHQQYHPTEQINYQGYQSTTLRTNTAMNMDSGLARQNQYDSKIQYGISKPRQFSHRLYQTRSQQNLLASLPTINPHPHLNNPNQHPKQINQIQQPLTTTPYQHQPQLSNNTITQSYRQPLQSHPRIISTQTTYTNTTYNSNSNPNTNNNNNTQRNMNKTKQGNKISLSKLPVSFGN